MQRQNFASLIRFSRVLWVSLLVVMLGGLLKSEAAAQTVSFAPKIDFGTGTTPYSVAVGDFNGDGKLDLVVTNSNNGNVGTVSILLGTGTGSFGAKTDFSTGSNPQSVAVGNFNGDGKLDLAVANVNSDTVSILLGTGTGSFGPKTDFATGCQPFSVTVGDFNGDGKLDLAVGNCAATVSILLGTGTGSFGAKTEYATGGQPFSVKAGDFNGDGKLDLATANINGDTVSILLGTGTGSFGAKTDFSTGSNPQSVAVGDFNGDDKLDLATANALGNTVSILLGTGTGSFGPKTDFGTGSGPVSVAVGDFNGDGKLDLATANVFTATVSILLGTGIGSFGAKIDFGTGSIPFSVAVGDFNGDGKLDLATANGASNTVSILLNTVPPGVCQVTELTPLAELANRYPVGSQFLSELELAAPTTPQHFMVPPLVDASLDVAMTGFQNDVRTRFGLSFPRTSGYRPSAYQAHLREIRDKLDQVFTIRRKPGRGGDCQERLDQLLVERAKHFPRLIGEEIPVVNRAGTSAHENQPSNAIDLGNVRDIPQASQRLIDDVIAPSYGLLRPSSESDPFHFILLGRPAAQTIRATVRSPLTILIQDPLGRKVGFDPATISDVNQIGSTAFYSGPNAEPQYIEISDAMVGTYTVTGIGTGTGPYTLMLERLDEDGEVLESKATSGIVSLGEIVSLNISLFDTCIQDESNGNILQFNSTSGDYQFTRRSDGFTLNGTGQVIKRACGIFLQDFSSNRRVVAQINNCQNIGTAAVQVFALGRTFTIVDRNTTNNTGTCH